MAPNLKELRPVMVRIPESVRRQLAREAKKNGRSMNTEIIHRLGQSLVSADVTELYRQYAEIAAERAADLAAKKIIEQLLLPTDQAQEPSPSRTPISTSATSIPPRLREQAAREQEDPTRAREAIARATSGGKS